MALILPFCRLRSLIMTLLIFVAILLLRSCSFIASFGLPFSACAFTFCSASCLNILLGLIISLLMRIRLRLFLRLLLMVGDLCFCCLLAAVFASVFSFLFCSSFIPFRSRSPFPWLPVLKSHPFSCLFPYWTFPRFTSKFKELSCSWMWLWVFYFS